MKSIMKILLVAMNAKYIHSNLAVYSLKAYAQSCYHTQQSKVHIEIAEYTVNQTEESILADIYRKEADMVCFSCYIWNIIYIEEIVRELGKVMPQIPIWLGGPEVSYDAREVLERLPEVEGVIKGEGEETFSLLLKGESREKLAGITYRDASGLIHENAWREVMDLNRVPFVYEDMEGFQNKIIYYESSRGCPFSCSYCLSSIDKKLRFRDLGLVEKELAFFLQQKVRQVKFVDRTFNCSHSHAMGIWNYLYEHDNGITNFHFEISADLLNEEEVALIQKMRPGLIQLEIGVQSTNPNTIREINRTMKLQMLSEAVQAIGRVHNVHQHLDLIAGLPYETMESFAKSFDEVYAWKPDQLQLGFLKVLKGSDMALRQEEYGLVCKSSPPYEVLYTKWLDFKEVLQLKGIEEMVEIYYNSGQYRNTMEALKLYFPSAFQMYDCLSRYYVKEGLHLISHKRSVRYEILLSFIARTIPEQEAYFRDLLLYDYYLRENAKSRPDFAGEYLVGKEELRRFYQKEEEERRYLPGHIGCDRNQMRKMTHLERFSHLEKLLLFDYESIHPLTGDARTVVICNL